MLDENKKPAELGNIYFFPFGEGLLNPEQRDTCRPAKKIFNRVECYYYQALKEKYVYADEVGDDDF